MHDLKPFYNTVLINLKAGVNSGTRNSYINWQTWLNLTNLQRDQEVEKAVRKYYLNSLKYTYEVASVIPDKILCAAIWYKPASLEIENPINIEFGTVFAGRRHSNCY